MLINYDGVEQLNIVGCIKPNITICS